MSLLFRSSSSSVWEVWGHQECGFSTREQCGSGSVCLVRSLSLGACRTSRVREVSSPWKLPVCWELCSLCSGGQCDRAVSCAALQHHPGLAELGDGAVV